MLNEKRKQVLFIEKTDGILTGAVFFARKNVCHHYLITLIMNTSKGETDEVDDAITIHPAMDALYLCL